MATTTFGTGAAGITQIGLKTTATAWGGSSGGTRVTCYGGFYSQVDVLFTAASAVSLGAYYAGGTATDLVATLLDSTGVTTINTITPTLTTGAFVDTPVSLFTGLTEGTQYWLRLRFNGNQNDLLCSANFLQFTTSTTATLANAYPSNTVYAFDANQGATNILPALGLEGGVSSLTLNSWKAMKNVTPAGGTTNYAMLRFKATIGSIWLYQYQASGVIHLNRLPADGSSGVPLDAGQTFTVPGGGGNTSGWQLLASGLDTSTEYIYEMSFGSGSGANVLLFAIMTSGGTGINAGVTGSTLVRPLLLAVTGDSTVAGETPDSHPFSYSFALLGQATNNQILNVGMPGENLQSNSASSTRYQDLQACGVPQAVLIREGINDYKSGSPPSATTMSGYMITLTNKIRGLSGFSAVPVYVSSMLPYSGTTYALLEAYNSGANGFSQAVVTAYNAGTAAGQSPSPDPNVYYLNASAWELASHAWVTGGSFNATNFQDGLHLNTTGAAVEKSFLIQTFGVPATAITMVVSVPPSGAPLHPSPPFTLALFPTNGSLSGTANATLDDGAGGSFSPNPVPLTAAAPSGTFTYTPPAGLTARTITVTNDRSLTNPSPATYTVAAELIASTLTALVFALVGTSSNWSGSPFSLTSGGGALSSQTVTDTTHATVTITTGGSPGPWTIFDGTATLKLETAAGGGGSRMSIGL